MSAKNVKKKKKIEGDRYYTPTWLVNQCMDSILPIVCPTVPETISEPCAGTGRFVKALRKKYEKALIAAIDLYPPSEKPWPEATVSYFGDYLEVDISDPDSVVDFTISNPPFGLALAIIEHALFHSRKTIMLVRQGFLSSSERAKFFRENPPAYVFIVANRPAFDVPSEVLSDPEYDWTEGQTDSADYCFVCWDREHEGFTQLHWLPEVPKELRRWK